MYNRQCIIRQRSCQTERPLVVVDVSSVFWLFFQANLILINHPHRPSLAKSEFVILRYMECHGKDVPDGVAATIKRQADSLVVRGHDIEDASTMVQLLTKKTKINLRLIDAEFHECQEQVAAIA